MNTAKAAETGGCEQDIVRERALRAFAALRSQAVLNGTADMSLDEINEEIRAARAGESVAASDQV